MLYHIPQYRFLHAIISAYAAGANPSLYCALETTACTFCPLAPRQQSRASNIPSHCYELLSLLAWVVTFSFPAAAKVVRQSLRGNALALSHTPRDLCPYSWPLLCLLTVLKQQISPFCSLPLLLSKPLLLKPCFFFLYSHCKQAVHLHLLKLDSHFTWSNSAAVLLELPLPS